ncbi:MAG: hypothetical protein JXB49_09580 [Bacteroidales bacterium]|nr:hypothetical protein [Bacteroidales bacterium]
MLKISVVLLSIFLTIPFNRSQSQPLTGSQLRKINEALLELINDYESYSRFTTDNKRINDNYISLFTDLFDNNASLYIDILPSNKVSDQVSLSQYISILNKYYSTGVGVKLHNILFDLPINLGKDRYKVNAELSKEIYGYTGTNVYYRDTIPLVLTIGFSISGDDINDIKILGISGEPKGRFLKLRVLKSFTRKPVENSEIRIDSKLVQTDSQGIAVIENIEPNKRHNLTISHDSYKPIVYSNIDIDKFVEGNTNRNHQILRLPYYDQNEFIFFMNTLNFTLAPVVSFGFPGLKTIVSEGQNDELELENFRERGSLSPRIGIRFGITLLTTTNIEFSLNSGVEKNFIRAAYSFDTCHITNVVGDPFHGGYIELINLYKHKQNISLSFTDFPIFAALDYKKFKGFSLGVNFGIRFSNLNKSTCSIKSGYETIGTLEPTDTILSFKYYNFITEKKFLSYQVGLTISKEILPSLDIYMGPTIFFYNKDLFKNELVSGTILSPDKQLNNILNTYSRSKIQNVALEFGIKYNFNSINLK